MKNHTPATATVPFISIFLLSETHATDLAEDRAGLPAVRGTGTSGA